MVGNEEHDHVHHGDHDRGCGEVEVGQCHVGVKGIVKDMGRGGDNTLFLMFDASPQTLNTLFYKKPTTWRLGSTFLRKPKF